MNSVGERLREARLTRGLTQEQLAKGLATKGFISQVERNHAMPSLAKLRLMAERLGLPLGYFTGDSSPLELTYLRKSAELAVKAKEPERALALVEEATGYTLTANERADLLRIKGTALDEMQRLSEALVAHQSAAAAAPPDDPELNGAIYCEIATVLNEQEQFNAAIEAGLRALHWLDLGKDGDPALRSRILLNLGRSTYYLGQLDQAHAYSRRALDAASDSESLYRIANAHMSLGVSARATGRLDEAIEHCNRALELWARLGHERTANRVLNNIGDVHYAAGRRARAWEFQERCLIRSRELHDDASIGVCALELARYALEAGKVDLALRYARESRAGAERAGDHMRQAVATAIEGAAVERSGRRLIANRLFRTAMTMLLEREVAGKLAEVCAMYAEVLQNRGEANRAFVFMRVAAERDFSKLPALMRARK